MESLEKQSLQNQFKSNSTTKKSSYGALKKETKNCFTFNLKHKLERGETLEGISLKYGISVENIKRANRLWNNDLLAIKDFLIIPIPEEKSKEFINNEQTLHKKLPNENNHSRSQSFNQGPLNDSQKDSCSLKDYLSKFDSFISESKTKLKTLEASASVSSENDSLFFNSNKPRSETSSLVKEPMFHEPMFNDDLSNTPDYKVKQFNTSNPSFASLNNSYTSVHSNNDSNNNSNSYYRTKKAQDTLQKLEKEKDDFYEL